MRGVTPPLSMGVREQLFVLRQSNISQEVLQVLREGLQVQDVVWPKIDVIIMKKDWSD